MTKNMFYLRLNQSYLLRNGDITASFEHDKDTFGDCDYPMAPKWIKMTMLRGKIYDDIYSPGALLEPETVRDAGARELVTALQTISNNKDHVEVSAGGLLD